METERDELDYQDGNPTWFIILTILAMAAVLIGYSVTYFFPDLANWLKEGADPDKIIWLTEKGN